jgi:hypothetical protein
MKPEKKDAFLSVYKEDTRERIRSLFDKTLEWAEAVVENAAANPEHVNAGLVLQIMKFLGDKIVPDAKMEELGGDEPLEIIIRTNKEE